MRGGSLPECAVIPSQEENLQLTQMLGFSEMSLLTVTAVGTGLCSRDHSGFLLDARLLTIP